MCKKFVLVVSLFGSDVASNSNSRTINIIKSLSENNDCIVKYVIADFDHRKKVYKKIGDNAINISCIHVPPYSENLSLKRIYSHIVFAMKLRKYLNGLEEKPYVIYCAMPTSTTAYMSGKYCKKYGIKFVIDVIDLWPDSIMPLTSFKKTLSLLTYPWKWITIRSYKMANIIIGESRKYACEASKYNPSVPVYPLYLGVDQELVNEVIAKHTLALEKPKDEIWIAYAGSLGTSYDFETLIRSISTLNNIIDYKLWFIGDGVARCAIEKMLQKYCVNAEITGFLSYEHLLKYLSYCDIAINIFRKDTKVVHSYKFNDYVATQCFILNSLEGETADMIEEYQIGLNFDFEDNSLDKVLLECISNWDKYHSWKINNRRLVAELLDKRKIYSKISSVLIE